MVVRRNQQPTVPETKHVVFDVVGTLVSFDAFYEGIDQTIGPKLQAYSISAESFGYIWMTHSELEFTFLSMSSHYTAYNLVMKALFYRTLSFMGAKEPRSLVSEEERDQCQEFYSQLQVRDGAKECIETLRQHDFRVLCFTTADIKRVQGYFAHGGIEMPADSFVSCDDKALAKPALKAYQQVLDKFQKHDVTWYAAAHMWDVCAARRAGFKGAYCTVYEKESCPELYGDEVDIITSDLVEMARSIIAAES